MATLLTATLCLLLHNCTKRIKQELLDTDSVHLKTFAYYFWQIYDFLDWKKSYTEDRGAPKSAGPVAIATFATIVNPALGVTLDRSLTFKNHTQNYKAKATTPNDILHKLVSSQWESNPPTLRTSAVALLYSAAEYHMHIVLILPTAAVCCIIAGQQLSHYYRCLFHRLPKYPPTVCTWAPAMPAPQLQKSQQKFSGYQVFVAWAKEILQWQFTKLLEKPVLRLRFQPNLIKADVLPSVCD